MRLALLSLLVPALAAGAALRSDPVRVEITEWKVPWEKSRPRDPVRDTKGRVWFVGQEGNYVAYLDPRSGQFKRYEVEAGTNPHTVTVDPNGGVWITGNRNARLVKLDPATGKLTTVPMPDAAAKDPHTLVFDRKGNGWFTAQFGNFVGHLVTATGQVHLVKMPTAGARPYGIVIDAAGRPWFDEFGTNRIGTLDPSTLALREYPLPSDRARPRRIAITSDGAVWYGDYTRGFLGRLDPKSGAVKEWALPAKAASLPYAMTVDDKDRLWLVETGVQPNRLVGFDPRTSEFFSVTPIAESGAGTVRHMTFDRATREIWFGTDANTIGRARVP